MTVMPLSTGRYDKKQKVTAPVTEGPLPSCNSGTGPAVTGCIAGPSCQGNNCRTDLRRVGKTRFIGVPNTPETPLYVRTRAASRSACVRTRYTEIVARSGADQLCTSTLTAHGTSTLTALTAGYHLVFWIAAALAAASIPIAATLHPASPSSAG